MNKKNTAAVTAVLAMLNHAVVAQEESAPLEEVVVIGSRIPRLKAEGPAPITTIDAKQISADGLASIPDVLRSLTQNAGETQSQASFNGADFTPGAQQVDLRGLGSNHTLVLVNGRRIADFPLPFNGLNNFTDISNIPLGMVEKVETLSGSSSAVYGSDAIAGVVNIVLKKQADGTTLNYRFGAPADGGGDSQRFTVTSGWSNGDFNAIFGLELLDQKPLWAFDRSIQDSTADNPVTDQPLARRAYLRYDYDNDAYVDPGQATCDALADQNKGTTYRASRPRYGLFDDDLDDYGPGYFCGSNESVSYGTILTQRKGATGYASLNYDLSDKTTLFADVMVGISKVELMNDVNDWQFQDASGSEDGYFFNPQFGDEGGIDSWYRQFSPEEMGGLERSMIHNDQRTITVTPGIRGSFGDNWGYEAYVNHTQYEMTVSWPRIVAAAANNLFLGEQQGVDEDSGLPIFDASVSRLYTPLSRTEFDSIFTRTTYHPKSRNDYLSFTLTKTSLHELPAGPIGFAANFEAGSQGYEINPDPLALTHYYYHYVDQDGHGSRTHWSGSYEFRIPVLESLQVSTAGRYDSYRFGGGDTGKFTYNLGVEFRPMEKLLLRGYYGTGFRAPDLHYVFAGTGLTHPSGTDYYRCRLEQPEEDIDNCDFAGNTIAVAHSGNRELQSETSTSFGAGFVWAPGEDFDVSLDYFQIELKDEVLDMSRDNLLRDESDCRFGSTGNGTAIDADSPTCVDAIARVLRNPSTDPVDPGLLLGVAVNPINVANESTSGVDLAFRYRLALGDASLTFSGGYTKVFDHDTRQFPGDPTVDEFRLDSRFDIPRSKASASVSFDSGAWNAAIHGQRLDRLPNYDEDAFIPASFIVNGTLGYKWSDSGSVLLAVDNLLDKAPVKDKTYGGYPYYDISWFDPVGRTYYLEFNYNFGGK
jgi:outer membrane receptor protein involved in Fe transport